MVNKGILRHYRNCYGTVGIVNPHSVGLSAGMYVRPAAGSGGLSPPATFESTGKIFKIQTEFDIPSGKYLVIQFQWSPYNGQSQRSGQVKDQSFHYRLTDKCVILTVIGKLSKNIYWEWFVSHSIPNKEIDVRLRHGGQVRISHKHQSNYTVPVVVWYIVNG